jgi:amino acid transporter
MVLAACLALPIGYVYAELASAFPVAGGEYSMVARAAGHPAGFAALGITVATNILAPAVLALGASTYLAVILPEFNPVIVAMALFALTTVLGILHIRTTAWVTGIFLLLELLALAVLALLGFLDIKRPLWEIATHPVMVSDGALQATPLALIGVATSVSIFAYNGYGSAVYFAEEMHEAPRLVARTILWALVITVITELVPLTAVLLGAPDPVRRFRRGDRRPRAEHYHQSERSDRNLQRRAGDDPAERALLLFHRPRQHLAPAHQRRLPGDA